MQYKKIQKASFVNKSNYIYIYITRDNLQIRLSYTTSNVLCKIKEK